MVAKKKIAKVTRKTLKGAAGKLVKKRGAKKSIAKK